MANGTETLDELSDVSGVYDPAADAASEDVDLEAALEAEKLKTALAASEAMKKEEESLLQQYRSGPGSGVLAIGQPRPSLPPKEYSMGSVEPTSKGFMYVANPIESPSVIRPDADQRMIAAGGLTREPRRIMPWDRASDLMPGYERFAAQQDVNAAVGRGVPIQEALMQYPAAIQPSGRQRLPALRQTGPTFRNVSGVLYRVDPLTGQAVPLTAPKVTTSEGVKLRYRQLIADEKTAATGEDAGAISQARTAREAFEREHPELGISTGAAPVVPPKVLDKATALSFKQQAKGNLNKARELARAAGYTWPVR